MFMHSIPCWGWSCCMMAMLTTSHKITLHSVWSQHCCHQYYFWCTSFITVHRRLEVFGLDYRGWVCIWSPFWRHFKVTSRWKKWRKRPSFSFILVLQQPSHINYTWNPQWNVLHSICILHVFCLNLGHTRHKFITTSLHKKISKKKSNPCRDGSMHECTGWQSTKTRHAMHSDMHSITWPHYSTTIPIYK